MLLDGSAFFGDRQQPDRFQRQQLVKKIYRRFPEHNSPAFRSKIDKVVKEAKNETQLEEMISDMIIKEEEFMV
jgi:hypothetical protein